jgi:hypothetical protein
MPTWWMFLVGSSVGFILGVVFVAGIALWLMGDRPDELKPDPLRSDQR